MKKYLTLLFALLSLAGFAQQSTYYAKAKIDGVTRYVKVRRDLSAYPRTTQGTAAINAAIIAKAISISVLTGPGGSVARVIQPVTTAPSCTTCTGPAWLSARYTKSTQNVLVVQGDPVGDDGAGVTMRIERVDGVGMSLSNPQNPSGLSSGVDLPFGRVSINAPWELDWTLGPVPDVPIRLTFKKPGQNNFVTVITPTASTVPVTLFTSSTPPTCTTCTSGTSVGPATLASGFAEGTLEQLMALAPFVPQTNQYSSWPYGNSTQFLERAGTKIGFMKAITQTMTWLSRSDFRNGENLINTETAPDKVRSFEGVMAPLGGRSGPAWSTYGYPAGGPRDANCNPLPGVVSFTEIFNGVLHSTAELCDNAGWNPVPGGSADYDRSPWLWWERRNVVGYGEVIYSKTQPLQWAMKNVPGKVYVHSWTWIDEAGAPRFFYIYENFRDDTQRIYQGRTQEWPFIYPIAPLYKKTLYTGSAPRTGGSVTEITEPMPVEGGDPLNNQRDTGREFGTENWIGATQPDGAGVYLYTPYNTAFRGKQFQAWYGNQDSNASSYINADVYSNGGDLNVTYAYTGALYVGNLTQFRSWLATQPAPATTSFGWDFTTGKTNGWFSTDGPAKVVGGRYRFDIGHVRNNGQIDAFWGFARFRSPAAAYKAADITKVYVRGKFSGITNVTFWWEKPRQTPTQSDANQQNFTVIGDGVERTYEITLTGNANWSGIITTVGVGNPYNTTTGARPTRQGTEWFEPSYIGTTNPGN